LNNNYSYKNDGIRINVNEYVFKEKEKKIKNFEEPSERKEITNFIYKINYYSARKISTFINWIPVTKWLLNEAFFYLNK